MKGGYGTHVICPRPEYLVPIPPNVDPAVAATYACSGVTVYSAINKVRPLLTNPEEPLVLMGAGGLGLNAVALLKGIGHKNSIVVDIDDNRLKAAVEAGASKGVDGRGTTEEVVKRIVEACGGVAPVAIVGWYFLLFLDAAKLFVLMIAFPDLVNSTQTATTAFQSLRKGGKLVQVGLFGGSLEIPLPFMPIRALTIQGELRNIR